jgi:hypothetical protein
MPLTDPGSEAIYSVVHALVAQAVPEGLVGIDRLTAEVIDITRGMTDMAVKIADLKSRASRGVFGYLCNSMPSKDD